MAKTETKNTTTKKKAGKKPRQGAKAASDRGIKATILVEALDEFIGKLTALPDADRPDNYDTTRTLAELLRAQFRCQSGMYPSYFKY